MTDDGLLVVVGIDAIAAERCAESLRAAGASAESCVVNVDDLATLSAPGIDAVVLDAGDEPERFLALSAALRRDERTARLPLVVSVAAGVVASRVSALGPAAIATPSNEGSELFVATQAALDRGRDAAGVAARARDLEDRLRATGARLDTVGTETRSMAHDARVLCGIIVGYAANLRDEIVGPLEDEQRVHVAQILQATDDLVSLLERFSGVVRATTDAPPSRGDGRARGPARRILCNLGELVRGTVGLFDNVAEQKRIAVTLDVDDGLTAWCDPLKIKQVVTNLVVNALKFAPVDGHVAVHLRAAEGRGDQGTDARRNVELVVEDTGPGIPLAERERVFVRGARLERDRDVPGSGIGLAVVREIMAEHKGSVRVEDAPGAGASVVVTLPTDMRSREGRSFVLVDDAAAAQRIVDALHKRDDGTGWRFDLRRDSVVEALAKCAAVVIVPHGAVPVIDLGPISERAGAPPSSRGSR